MGEEQEVRLWVNQALRELGADKMGGTDWESVRNKLTQAVLWCGPPDLEERFRIQFRLEGLAQESAQRLAGVAAWVVTKYSLAPTPEGRDG